MTDKLTLSDCFKYPEAKIKIISDAEITGTYKRTLNYENIAELMLRNYRDYGVPIKQTFETFDCYLILRDITELTDEEKEYINDNFVYELFKDAIGERNWNTFNELFAICEHKLELIDYLRSINIDIDGFIASGKAVKE